MDAKLFADIHLLIIMHTQSTTDSSQWPQPKLLPFQQSIVPAIFISTQVLVGKRLEDIYYIHAYIYMYMYM